MITSQIHRDKALTNISIKYRNEDYIGNMVFPKLQVKKETDEYYIFKKDARIPETERANRARARESSFKMTYGTYYLREHALKDYISDRDKANYDLGDIRTDVTEWLQDKIDLRREKTVADYFNVTAEASATWSATVSLSAAQVWSSNSAGSDPIIIIDTMSTELVSNCFKEANTFIMPKDIKRVFKRHVSILDRIKYTSAEISDKAIASLIDIPKVLFPQVYYETTKEGASTITYSSLWGDNCWLGYVAASPGPRRLSAGYVFTGANKGVDRWYDDERSAEVIRVGEMYDVKVVADDAGALIVNCT